jgi:hypothetical protein
MAQRLKRPKPERAKRGTETLSVLPMELRPGDRFTDEAGTWEIVGRPTTRREGKEVEVKVQRLGEPAMLRDQWWPAYERVIVTRAAPR